MGIRGFTRLALAGRANQHNSNNHNNLEKTQNFLSLCLTGSKNFAIIHTWEEGDILPHTATCINYMGHTERVPRGQAQVGSSPSSHSLRRRGATLFLNLVGKSELYRAFFALGHAIVWKRDIMCKIMHSNFRCGAACFPILLGLDDLIAFSFTSKPNYLTFYP